MFPCLINLKGGLFKKNNSIALLTMQSFMNR
jgi:hypothetical protein